MEVKRVLQPVVVVVVVLLLAALNGARAAESVKYVKDSGNMVLEPSVGTAITNILWKHKGNLVAEWVKDVVDLTYYAKFKNRTILSITTGRLMITDMTKDDAGVYTLEINSKVYGESYAAKVIKEVPRPLVWIQPVACSPESPSCDLRCDGETPEEEAEPITYSWRKDEGEWDIPGKELSISKNTSATEIFSCRMENPVSVKESQPRENPFYKPPPPPVPIVTIVVVVLVVCVVAGLGFVGYKKKDFLKAKFNSSAANDSPNANGNSAGDKNTSTTETDRLNNPTPAEKPEDGEHMTERL